jgi:hypothetical protein
MKHPNVITQLFKGNNKIHSPKIMKVAKVKDKERIFKTARKNNLLPKKTHKITSRFFS